MSLYKEAAIFWIGIGTGDAPLETNNLYKDITFSSPTIKPALRPGTLLLFYNELKITILFKFTFILTIASKQPIVF